MPEATEPPSGRGIPHPQRQLVAARRRGRRDDESSALGHLLHGAQPRHPRRQRMVVRELRRVRCGTPKMDPDHESVVERAPEPPVVGDLECLPRPDDGRSRIVAEELDGAAEHDPDRVAWRQDGRRVRFASLRLVRVAHRRKEARLPSRERRRRPGGTQDARELRVRRAGVVDEPEGGESIRLLGERARADPEGGAEARELRVAIGIVGRLSHRFAIQGEGLPRPRRRPRGGGPGRRAVPLLHLSPFLGGCEDEELGHGPGAARTLVRQAKPAGDRRREPDGQRPARLDPRGVVPPGDGEATGVQQGDAVRGAPAVVSGDRQDPREPIGAVRDQRHAGDRLGLAEVDLDPRRSRLADGARPAGGEAAVDHGLRVPSSWTCGKGPPAARQGPQGRRRREAPDHDAMIEEPVLRGCLQRLDPAHEPLDLTPEEVGGARRGVDRSRVRRVAVVERLCHDDLLSSVEGETGCQPVLEGVDVAQVPLAEERQELRVALDLPAVVRPCPRREQGEAGHEIGPDGRQVQEGDERPQDARPPRRQLNGAGEDEGQHRHQRQEIAGHPDELTVPDHPERDEDDREQQCFTGQRGIAAEPPHAGHDTRAEHEERAAQDGRRRPGERAREVRGQGAVRLDPEEDRDLVQEEDLRRLGGGEVARQPRAGAQRGPVVGQVVEPERRAAHEERPDAEPGGPAKREPRIGQEQRHHGWHQDVDDLQVHVEPEARGEPDRDGETPACRLGHARSPDEPDGDAEQDDLAGEELVNVVGASEDVVGGDVGRHHRGEEHRQEPCRMAEQDRSGPVDGQDQADGRQGRDEGERPPRDAKEEERHRGAVRLGDARVVLAPEEHGELAPQDAGPHQPRHRLVGVELGHGELDREEEEEQGEERPEAPVARGGSGH